MHRLLPHSSFGAPECIGCLNTSTKGNKADIVCNECSVVVRTVPATDLPEIVEEMELEFGVATVVCPPCGMVNLFPGFASVAVFTCKSCGEATELSPSH